MCGIAGLIGQDPQARIGAMLKAIEHRGRDDEGVWASPAINGEGQRVTFGHRRLSIIDTSAAGHQPMLLADERLVVVLNGEIYNYRELRAQLTTKGHRFRTQTDTEVLLAAWAEWGEECLTRLNGMFAFALWDDQERALFLVRDRVGIKPLYYAHHAGTDAGEPQAGCLRSDSLVFASEVKSILASGSVKAELDRESLHQFLTFLWVPDPNTLFHGIKTVPPGHLVKWRDHELTVREWWDISFDTIEEGRSDAWWQEQVLETLDRTVKLEMVADVPLGSFLSGGIDSSSIVALMKNHSHGRRIGTYTIGIEAEDLRYDIIPDDVQWARRVNQQLDTDYHEIMLQPKVAELLPKLVYHMDEPAIDMAIPSYLVSRAARETLTVMLSGMGGDEVFAGYPIMPRSDAVSMLGESGALTFTLGGLSKSAGLPQLKLGWMVVSGPDAIVAGAMERLELICDTYLSVSTPVQLAAAKLIASGKEIREAIKERVQQNYHALERTAKVHPSVRVIEPEGGWSVVIEVPETAGEDALVQRILHEAHVVVHPGYFFDIQRGAHIVVSLLPPPDVFADAIRRVLDQVAAS